jgi:membrane-bound metal-dependent hydrolase YbcI (DUF457 family)
MRLRPKRSSGTPGQFQEAEHPLEAMLFSIAPDLDMAPGVLLRRTGQFHNGISHSLFSGLLFALAVFLGGKPGQKPANGRRLLRSLLYYELHLLTDYFAGGRRGLLLFWPLSRRRFRFPLKLFYGVRWDQGVTSHKHLLTLSSELGIAGLGYALWRLLRACIRRLRR